MWSLDNALLEVEHLSRSCDATIELNALRCTSRRAADQCRLCIIAFFDKTKSYNKSLGPGGSGSRLRDAAKRIQWTFAQKDELAKFRTELNGHASAINMLLVTASLNFTKITGRNINSKLAQIEKKHENSANKTNSILNNIQTRLIDNNTQLPVQDKRIDIQEQAWSRLKNGMQYFSTLSSELKEFMSSILSTNRDNYKILLKVQSRIPREFKPCWIQEPVMFTDALGRIMPIHIEVVNSWEVFDVVLAARFINLPGKLKIARKEIAFEDRYLAKDVERCRPFDSCFLPGRRIDMSMVFKQHNLCTSCPKCGLKAESSLGRAVQCTGTDCGLWFQIIEEVNDDLADDGTASSESRCRKGNIQSGNQASKKRKREIVSIEEEDIRAFQRVRLLSKLRNSSDVRQRDSLNDSSHSTSSTCRHSSPLELSKMLHTKQLGPSEAQEAETKLALPASTYDFSRFLYDKDVSSQQYENGAGSSGTLNSDRFTSRTVTSFPNPYSNSDFYSWLFGEQDTNDTGNDYLSTLLGASDSTCSAPESTQNTFSAWQ